MQEHKFGSEGDLDEGVLPVPVRLTLPAARKPVAVVRNRAANHSPTELIAMYLSRPGCMSSSKRSLTWAA